MKNNRKSGREKRTGARIRHGTGILLILVGCCVYLYPIICDAIFEYRSAAAIREFQSRFGLCDNEISSSGESLDEEAVVYPSQYTDDTEREDEQDALYQACFAYNCRIYAASQSGLKDVESYETFNLGEDAVKFLSNDMFGYLEIPAMDILLPLYLGASVENMAAGAAVLGETSAPIGGLNTNTVISGHRGYRGSPYFREIEKLTVGDVVYVTNPWETLIYEVSEIDIISPQNAEAVKIQEGRDMITLLTCHPYRSGGKYRYVVYCDRVNTENSDKEKSAADSESQNVGATAQTEDATEEESDTDSQTSTVVGTEYIIASDGTTYVSSENDIRTEGVLRLGSGIFLMGIFLFLTIFRRNTEENVHINEVAEKEGNASSTESCGK